MTRLAVIVDTANLYYAIKRNYPNKKLNYMAYLNAAVSSKEIVRAIAYSPQALRDARGFADALIHAGFEICFKKQQQQMALAIMAITLATKIETLILGSSDPIFIPLIQYLQTLGVKVIVFACNIPQTLKSVATTTWEVSEIILQEDV